ncbi:MAG: ATP-binding cassette domain-containing protein [Pseudomonadota bacterium]
MAAKRKQDAARAHMQSFVDRFRAKASKAKQAQSRLKMLERMEPIAALVENNVAAFGFPSPEELSPPIVAMNDAAVGYDVKPVLKGLNLRIDQDDRIALLGANGQGKSTLSKLIAGRLAPMDGDMRQSPKLRIGYFAQHQLDELYPEETPLQHVQRERPGETPAKLRARLAAGGIPAAIAETEVKRLSGGQKARLAMLLCAIDAPHLLILDEPTNHLDIESREALVRALADYNGAVILVSHDPHLVSHVADRLWLVRDGNVAPFNDDMDGYRRLLLGEPDRTVTEKPKRRANPSEARRTLSLLKAELAKCEARIARLEEMRDKIDLGLADPKLYETGDQDRIEMLQAKRREVMDGLERAEALWLDAQDRLDRAEAAR